MMSDLQRALSEKKIEANQMFEMLGETKPDGAGRSWLARLFG